MTVFQDATAEDRSRVKDHMICFLDDKQREAVGPYFNPHEFLDYLYSKHNQLWNPAEEVVNQDMEQPLTHYWIASSHNTSVKHLLYSYRDVIR